MGKKTKKEVLVRLRRAFAKAARTINKNCWINPSNRWAATVKPPSARCHFPTRQQGTLSALLIDSYIDTSQWLVFIRPSLAGFDRPLIIRPPLVNFERPLTELARFLRMVCQPDRRLGFVTSEALCN